MIETLMPLVKQFLPFAQERMGFHKPPRLFLRGDSTNADNPLGKTASYDPGKKSITLYITGRHPKDVMRSLSHELVHHTQNCNGKFNDVGEMGEGYAQNDDHLREMEREAYEVGNMCFRDWEDSIRSTIYFESLQKVKGVNKKMSIKDWKDGELNSLLLEKWGFKFDLDKLKLEEAGNPHTGGTGDRPTPKRAKEDIAGEEGAEGKREEEDLDEIEEAFGQAKSRRTGSPKGYAKKKCKDAAGERVNCDSPGAVPMEEAHDPDWGMGKGEKSRTDPGEEDYTTKKGGKTKKGEKAYEDPSKGEEITTSGSKKRGSKKGDEAYVNEDTGEEEGEHYEHSGMHDEDHIKAIEHHLDALKHDKDYDEEHEIEERRGRGRNDPRVQRGTPDPRARPLEEEDETSVDRRQYTDSQVREALKRAIKVVKERKIHGQKR
jgi:hypothetical protein